VRRRCRDTAAGSCILHEKITAARLMHVASRSSSLRECTRATDKGCGLTELLLADRIVPDKMVMWMMLWSMCMEKGWMLSSPVSVTGNDEIDRKPSTGVFQPTNIQLTYAEIGSTVYAIGYFELNGVPCIRHGTAS
jgi:hypothetical protein